MAETNQDIKFISRLNTGFPDYLDWEKLRAAGLEHLGNLSGKIWTDHNVHDPGITILEMLCYAIMDLGYRTNLPAADIFAKNPGDKSTENNFFTPAQILTCNPVTITDFRKLLVDIEGVKNAWLEDSFYTGGCYDPQLTNFKETYCSDCYNGLYRVYIEAENSYDPVTIGQNELYTGLVKKIRDTLMAHRNLCEDFIDIRFLCKQKIGLCADVELEADVDPEEVYQNIIEAIREFFSPSPKFYTLQYLLEQKNKTIDEIFAGRPYDINESHGFTDTEEFENIKLKKELHLSDLYTVILNVAGVDTVTNLGWKNDCAGSKKEADKSWILKIEKDHVPDFSTSCSMFRFTRNGIPLKVDTQKFNELLEAGFTHTGKVLYKKPSPYLDVELPKATYRPDLGEYQSIQNEFPRVYGINEGGLPNDVSDKRKAQALQLKAYLLFFDQLLANYIAQLKNMRSLFSLSGSGNGNNPHTYFLNQLTDVPQLKKLLRFPVEGEKDYVLGTSGNLLAVPVKRKWIDELIKNDGISKLDLENDIRPSVYRDMTTCDIAVNSMLQDMTYGDAELQLFSNSGRCWFFCYFTSSGEAVLLSNKYYETEKAAREAAAIVKYIAAYRNNYHTSINSDNEFSFTLDLGMVGYEKYLQPLGEDKYLANQRRQWFLDHLLSRFAERFTDFALLSYGFMKENKLVEKEIQQKERFLTQYDDLSSNRGKAYDYRADGWNNKNLSGFEKRTFALAGMEELKRHHLCNFVVEHFEEYFILSIKLNDESVLFSSSQKFYSREAAEETARTLIISLKQKNNYDVSYDSATLSHCINVECGKYGQVKYNHSFDDPDTAERVKYGLYKLFSFEPGKKDVQVSRMVYKLILRDHHHHEVAEGNSAFENHDVAAAYVQGMGHLVQANESWKFMIDKPGWFDQAYSHYRQPGKAAITNILAFKFDIDDTIVGRPGKYKFELLDLLNNFKFYSAIEYSSKEEAEKGSRDLLSVLSDPGHYHPEHNKLFDKYELHIKLDDLLLAKTDPYYESGPHANSVRDRITALVAPEQYSLWIEERPSGWDFRYLLSDGKEKQYHFKSRDEFSDYDHAFEMAKKYYAAVETMELLPGENGVILQANVDQQTVQCISIPGEELNPDEAQKVLDLKKYIYQQAGDPESQGYKQFVQTGITHPELAYLYRLVDKDHLHAKYTPGAVINTYQEGEKLKKDIFQHLIEYQFTDVFLGNECVLERKEEKRNTTLYHYQVKCKNGCVKPGLATALFESVTGYNSREEAMDAFSRDLLEIFMMGMDPENYGEGKFISIDPVTYDPCSTNIGPSLVFISDEIKEFFKWNPATDIIAALVKICGQYPFRYSAVEDDLFYQLFPCEQDNRSKTAREDCSSKSIKTKRYYFVLSDKDGKEIWQSIRHFSTLQETVQAFYFFFLLLRYPGNYCVQQNFCSCKNDETKAAANVKKDTCLCGWNIVIREVLAESKKRFGQKGEAWKAVEEFICVSQVENGFHSYFDSKSCAFTFDVSCDNLGLVHPCKYDTTEQRNQAIKKLFKPFKKGWQFPAVCSKGGAEPVLYNTRSEGIAFVDPKYFIPMSGEECAYCIGELIEKIEHAELKIKDNDYWLEADNIKIAWPVHKEQAAEKWWKAMLEIACYYPVIKLENGKYGIAIRLPGFNCCSKTEVHGDWHHNKEKETTVYCGCCVAWKSECCFDSCEKAMESLEKMKESLHDVSCYQPVFDCECGPYGIRLICSCTEENTTQYKNTYPNTQPANTESPETEPCCCNEIIAFNPQWYTTPRMDCEAVKRAKKLINAEGFHLAEHILLRPRCEEDCDDSNDGWCRIPSCQSGKINCTDWKWKPTGEEDPCDTTLAEISFKPAGDPYSFIATVVLPAWPERFRKAENRLVIENLLYQETPAHILLRVLWLGPQDFCRFEYHFKRWNHWISRDYSHKCLEKDPTCDLIKYLFRHQFEDFGECNVCVPCKTEIAEEKPCFVPEEDPCSKWDFQTNIRGLFCWNKPSVLLKRTANAVSTETSVRELEIIERDEPIGEPDITAPMEDPSGGEIPEATVKFYNRRMNDNKKQVRSIIKDSNNNKLAEDALTFVSEPSDSKTYFKLTESIMNNDKEDKRKGKKFLPDQQQVLVRHMTQAYLDRLLVSGMVNNQTMEPLEKHFRKLRKKGVDTAELLLEWHKPGLDEHSLGAVPAEITAFLSGKNK